MTMTLRCGSRTLDLSRPRVMGILNVTPDSFSDGGRFIVRDAALEQAARMVAEGAVIIDVGGESTRPGAMAVGEQEELDRVLPVVEALVRELDVAVSVDTSTAVVMREASRAGAHLLNDVRALGRHGALAAASASGLPVCLMHMQGEPGTMQQSPAYTDVVREVIGFLGARIDACAAAGIGKDRLLVDPGFGFGKTLAHNLALLARLAEFGALGVPLLAGLSRKSMVGAVLAGARTRPETGSDPISAVPVAERLHGSVAAAVIAAMRGARILRVHDVGPTVDALAMVAAIQQQEARA